MNIKQIEEDFDKEFDDYYDFTKDERKQPMGMAKKPHLVSLNKRIKKFYKAKFNQILDDMIDEEMPDALTSLESVGYLVKKEQLKEYKKKFNQ